jgi:hypothetical protein
MNVFSLLNESGACVFTERGCVWLDAQVIHMIYGTAEAMVDQIRPGKNLMIAFLLYNHKQSMVAIMYDML